MPSYRVHLRDSRPITIHARDRDDARRKAGARLAAQRPGAVIVAITEIGRQSPSERVQADLRRQGYNREQAYEEVHGESAY